MGEMMDYFETRAETLDTFDLSSITNYMENHFVSTITFDGNPILPPVMTSKRREEMSAYKRQAQIAETRLKARKREKIAKRARTLVEDLKDSRAARRRSLTGTSETAESRPSMGRVELQDRDSRLNTADNDCTAKSSSVTESGAAVSNADPSEGYLAESAAGSLRVHVQSNVEGRNSPFLLDSMSDIPSLEDTATSLPTEYGGMPLTSTKQQQISQVLAKLSKVLNIQDSLTSTSSSAISEEISRTVVDTGDESSQRLFTCGDVSGTSTLGCSVANSVSLPFAETSTTAGMTSHDTSQDTVLEFTTMIEETTSGYIEGSSPASASSNSTPKGGPQSNDDRTSDSKSPPDLSSKASPKSPKNTVHFATTVMEIYTDNQSGKSSTLVKSLQSSGGTPRASDTYDPDLTEDLLHQLQARKAEPKLNTRVGVPAGQQDLSMSDSVQLCLSMQTDHSVSLLSKVVLSPEGDSSCSSTKEMQLPIGHIPFQSYIAIEGETSDKENEFASKSIVVSSSASHISAAEWEPSKSGSRSTFDSNNDVVIGLNISRDPSPSEQIEKNTREYLSISRSSNMTGRESSLSRVSLQSMSTDSVDADTLTGGTASTRADLFTRPSDVRESSATISSSLTMTEEVSDSHIMTRQNNNVKVAQNKGIEKEVKELNITVHDAEIIQNSRLTQKKDEAVSGNSNKKHMRKGSYTLDAPSPALIQVSSKLSMLETEERPVSNVAGESDEPARQNVSVSLIASADQPVQRKLEYDEEMDEDPVQRSPETQIERDAELQGKQEHLDRYLDSVQQQAVQGASQILLSVDRGSAKIDASVIGQQPDEVGMEVLDSFNLSTLPSFSFDYNRVNRMSQEEVMDLQGVHFDTLRKHLIEQQKMQLEQLFHQQQQEQILLQKEIEERSRILHEQQQFLQRQSLPGSQTISNQLSLAKVQNIGPPMMTNVLNPTAAVPTVPPVPDQAKTSPRQRAHQRSSPYNYVSSPSLNKHPSDHDSSLVSTFSRTTPKQYLFGNSSPSVASAHNVNIPLNKPVLRSPRRGEPELHVVRNRKLVIPDKAYESSMKPCFDRVSAVVKGYLTRRLLQTEKVQNFIKTIRDTRSFALNFQSETPVKKGNFSMQDHDLLERIIAQLQATLLDIHEVFFEIPVSERMAMIAQSRQLEVERHYKGLEQGYSVDRSHPRVSTATLKAIERKKRAQAAEAAVFGTSRPQSAPPPETSSPRQARSMDLSGPLRRHYQFLFSRALRPLQGQISPIRAVGDDVSASRMKGRPHTAPDRTTITNHSQAANKAKKSNIVPTERRRPSKSVLVKARSASVSAAIGGKPSSTAGAKSTKSDKAWR